MRGRRFPSIPRATWSFCPSAARCPDYGGVLLPRGALRRFDCRAAREDWVSSRGTFRRRITICGTTTIRRSRCFARSENGKFIPAVVQGTKRGELFIFNRLTGEPFFPIVEKPVPQSDVPGEETAPTQPFPELPPPLVPQHHHADAFGDIYFDRRNCRERMEKLRAEGIFTPPSLRGSLIVPGNTGGMNWSGEAYDQRRQWVVSMLTATSLPRCI